MLNCRTHYNHSKCQHEERMEYNGNVNKTLSRHGIKTKEKYLPITGFRESASGLSCQNQVSNRAITRRFCNISLCKKNTVQTEPLSFTHRTERLRFCLKHLNWSISDWKNVLFSDIALIKQTESGKVSVFSITDTCLEQRFLNQFLRNQQNWLLVWGCMSSKGVGALHRIEGSLTGNQYKNILEHIMVPDVLNNHFSEGFFTFQHNCSSISRFHIAEKWLNEQAFNVMSWPKQGEDLNPMKNIWNLLQMQINVNIKDVKEQFIWETVMYAWKSLQTNKDLCSHLMFSMPIRIHTITQRMGYFARNPF